MGLVGFVGFRLFRLSKSLGLGLFYWYIFFVGGVVEGF